jgi:hypothetical protein
MLPTDFQAAKPRRAAPSQREVGVISAGRPARWSGTACCGDSERGPQFPSSQSPESHAQNTTPRVIRQATDGALKSEFDRMTRLQSTSSRNRHCKEKRIKTWVVKSLAEVTCCRAKIEKNGIKRSGHFQPKPTGFQAALVRSALLTGSGVRNRQGDEAARIAYISIRKSSFAPLSDSNVLKARSMVTSFPCLCIASPNK